MQRQRRSGGQRHTRGSSAAENGHNQHAGGQLSPGASACVSTGYSGYGCGCGGCCCARKTSPLRRAVNLLRVHFGRAVSASSSHKGMAGAYLAAFVLLVWFGLQVSASLRGGGGHRVEAGGGGQQQQQQQELAAAAAGGGSSYSSTSTYAYSSGYREDDVGPRIAYGIMVYQRKGYSPQMTLDQFARMFNALYDKENT